MAKESSRRHRTAREPGEAKWRRDDVHMGDGTPPDEGGKGQVPEGNRPGHQPPKDQDKPEELGGAGHTGTEPKER